MPISIVVVRATPDYLLAALYAAPVLLAAVVVVVAVCRCNCLAVVVAMRLNCVPSHGGREARVANICGRRMAQQAVL